MKVEDNPLLLARNRLFSKFVEVLKRFNDYYDSVLWEAVCHGDGCSWKDSELKFAVTEGTRRRLPCGLGRKLR